MARPSSYWALPEMSRKSQAIDVVAGPSFAIPTHWTFRDQQVAAGFDRHVREQLPWYELATGAVAHVARHYVPEFGTVYDLGASTGNIGRALAPTLTARKAKLIPVESSQEMACLYAGPGLENQVGQRVAGCASTATAEVAATTATAGGTLIIRAAAPAGCRSVTIGLSGTAELAARAAVTV